MAFSFSFLYFPFFLFSPGRNTVRVSGTKKPTQRHFWLSFPAAFSAKLFFRFDFSSSFFSLREIRQMDPFPLFPSFSRRKKIFSPPSSKVNKRILWVGVGPTDDSNLSERRVKRKRNWLFYGPLKIGGRNFQSISFRGFLARRKAKKKTFVAKNKLETFFSEFVCFFSLVREIRWLHFAKSGAKLFSAFPRQMQRTRRRRRSFFNRNFLNCLWLFWRTFHLLIGLWSSLLHFDGFSTFFSRFLALSVISWNCTPWKWPTLTFVRVSTTPNEKVQLKMRSTMNVFR